MNRTRGMLLLGCALAACAQPEPIATPALLRLPDTMAECPSLPPMDQAVIDCALTELLDAFQDAYPIQEDGTRPAPHVYVLPVIGPPPEIARRIAGIRLPDPPALPSSMVPEELRASLEQATHDASARARTGHAGFLSGDPRVRVLAESSWDTLSITIGVSPPGYGFECDLAVVRFSIPAGVHSIPATSVLARSPLGWTVIARKGGPRRGLGG